MSDDSMTLAPFYRGWDRYQGLLVESIAGLSAEQLGLSTASAQRPVWTLAAHIIAARVAWFHRTLGEGDPAISSMQTWDDDGEPQRSAAELVAGLETTWRLIAECLDRWSPAMLDDTFTTWRGRTVSRQWIIWHVIEHDMHHGGELCFTLGSHGLLTPDL